jgi:hypothetical protein
MVVNPCTPDDSVSRRDKASPQALPRTFTLQEMVRTLATSVYTVDPDGNLLEFLTTDL